MRTRKGKQGSLARQGKKGGGKLVSTTLSIQTSNEDSSDATDVQEYLARIVQGYEENIAENVDANGEKSTNSSMGNNDLEEE
ncbi:hypothetical protein COP2_025430 [Malus domestica]